jgi:hypothetical protein
MEEGRICNFSGSNTTLKSCSSILNMARKIDDGWFQLNRGLKCGGELSHSWGNETTQKG